MRKNIDLKKFQNLLLTTFPPIKLGIGYGSAFFQQKNYDYKAEMPLLDLIFVVGDRTQWHSENLKRNRDHYGGLSYFFGAKYINLVQNMFSPIHYNPFINIEEFKIKYGVIGEDDFKEDLANWETLVVAGRLHKPVKQILGEGTYDDLLNLNLRNAVAAALLLDGRSAINVKELFFNIASLSYVGDIRFTIKGENQNKIINIVEGQFEQLKKLYYPILKAAPFDKILRLDEAGGIIFVISGIFLITSPIFQMKTNMHLSNFFHQDQAKIVNNHCVIKQIVERQLGDFKQTLFMRADEQKSLLKDAISDINSSMSKKMILYHLFTVSPFKNLKYAFSKLSKGFSSKKQTTNDMQSQIS